MADERDDVIEVGEEVEVDVIVDGSGEVLGAVVDDLIVVAGAEGAIVDETIDVLDADGELVAEDELVSVYDADGNLVAQEETVIVAIED